MPDPGTEALSRIDAHERVCTERWEQARRAAAESKTSIDALADKIDANAAEAREGRSKIYGLFWTVMLGLVAALLAIAGFLFVKAYG